MNVKNHQEWKGSSNEEHTVYRHLLYDFLSKYLTN